MAAEVNRNVRLGRGLFCSRACSAASSNKSDVRSAQRAARNKLQVGKANPNWKGGISLVDSVMRSRRKHPERFKARKLVERAVESGRLVRPDRCSLCKNVEFCEAHHEDYATPLDVVWLCTKCHDKQDALMRKDGIL